MRPTRKLRAAVSVYAAHGPTQYAAGMTVSYDAQIQPAFTGANIRGEIPSKPIKRILLATVVRFKVIR
ncbi:hypothetical protein FRC0485_02057 [Corynebacterium diphtheriae]|nr:hypothetical protein FRC0485_02057 [Corynebacterium diphtheriae]